MEEDSEAKEAEKEANALDLDDDCVLEVEGDDDDFQQLKLL
jgi:hypothetical protein